MHIIIASLSKVQCKWVYMQIKKTCEEIAKGMTIALEHFCTKIEREWDLNISNETFIPKINSESAKEEIIAIIVLAKLIEL